LTLPIVIPWKVTSAAETTLHPGRENGRHGIDDQGWEQAGMKRAFWAIVMAALLALPASGALAAQTASITLSVTIPASPLLAQVEPGCAFAITETTRSAICAVTIRMAQPTLEVNGWRLSLSAGGAVEQTSGAALPASALQIESLQSIVATQGQSIDTVGGPYLPSNAAHRSLNEAQTVVMANPGFGNGTYTATILVRLTAPTGAASGAYAPLWIVGVVNNAI
jgi:hypothetical protein